jgi:hypothetical protein
MILTGFTWWCSTRWGFEGGGSANFFCIAKSPSLASQLPQVFVSVTKYVVIPNHCGSWLASDGGGSVDIFGTGSPLSPAGLAPTGFCGCHKICVQHESLWELALQAMALGQATLSAQAVRYRQQGWLPQGFVPVIKFVCNVNHCGSLPCKRWRWVRQHFRHRQPAIACSESEVNGCSK